MIKNLQVSDLVEIFQDIPIYVGDEEGGEIIFKKVCAEGLTTPPYFCIIIPAFWRQPLWRGVRVV